MAPEKAKEALERFMEELSTIQDVSESKVLKTFALELAIKAASYSLNTEAQEVLREQLLAVPIQASLLMAKNNYRTTTRRPC